MISCQGQLFEISPYTERTITRTRDDGNIHFGIGGIKIKDLLQLKVCSRIHGVENLGAIERDGQDVISTLNDAIVKSRHDKKLG